MAQYLPLFPLNLVLFPKMLLPLHIFEDKYKEMIGECIEQSSQFGVVYSKDDEIHPIGCGASIHQILKTYPDGRMDIVALGTKRFRVLYFNSEKAFLRGEVESYEDDIKAPSPGRENLDTITKLYHDAFHMIQHGEREALAPLPVEYATFHIAQRLNLDNELKQQLLNLQSEVERVEHLIRYLSEVVTYLRRAEKATNKAGGNGNLRKK